MSRVSHGYTHKFHQKWLGPALIGPKEPYFKPIMPHFTLLLTVPGSSHRSCLILIERLAPLRIAFQSFVEYVSPIVHTPWLQIGPWLVYNSRIANMV